MLMEEENEGSSLPDITDSIFQPQQESWTSVDHQLINGEQESIVWDETDAQETDRLSLSPKAGRDTPEEAEQWEQIVWPVRPMTCTSPPLSFATVQWDMPGPTAEASSFMTDSSVANELDSCGVTSLDPTSLSLLHQAQESFTQEVREGEDEFDSQLLDSDGERTGSCSEPCDATDVEEPTAQEQEDSTQELLDGNSEVPELPDSEEETEHSAASDPVETVDLIDILDEIEGSEEEVDSFVDLKLEEEQEGPGVLLTGQGDSEEEQTLPNGVKSIEETEEGGEVEEEQSVTNVYESEEGKTVSPSDVEVPAEVLQSDDSEPTENPDELIDLRQSALLEEGHQSGSEEDIEILERFNEDPTELEMCKNVDQNVDPEQLEAAHENEEPLIQAADNPERVENSQEILELTEKLEETSLQHQDCTQELSPQPELSESKQPEVTEEPEQIHPEEQHSEDQLEHLEESPEMELTEELTQHENADQPEEPTLSEQTVCVEAEEPCVAEQQEQTEPSEQSEQTTDASQQPAEIDDSEITEQLSAESEVTQQTAEAEFSPVDQQAGMPHQEEEVGDGEDGSVQTVVANGEQHKPPETAVSLMNGGDEDSDTARRLAERLYKLDGIQRVDVVKHIDKDNDFSRAVGEEYMKFFDFTGQNLDHALRSFLKVVVLIGETQERERVLQRFACRFHECNPDSFSSSGPVLALTCAMMLLNTDLHGQNVGKSMSSSKFVSNLDGMNEGENFSKDLLKSLYNSIKSEPLEWAIDEEELKSSVLVDEDTAVVGTLRSKANPFQDVPHDTKATVVKEGFLQRKLHADIDGKRTPWGKRGWKTFYGGLRGMVLYLQKDDIRKDHQINEEVVSVHHSLAEQAVEYTKRPHVFRLQTADLRVFLFQASSKVEMNSWISRINLVSALHSSPPFPAAVGSQRRFFRPILPASQSAHTLARQLQSHARMQESFKADLAYLQQNQPEGKKAKAKDLEEHRIRAEYLQQEMCRYEMYIQVLETWESVKKTDDDVLSVADLTLFDKAMCADSAGDEEEEDRLKRSHSSPSLELEIPAPTVIKVKRNISERRTYRKTIIPKWNKEA